MTSSDESNFQDIRIIQAIGTFDTKKDMAEKFYKIQPIYYDKSRSWWLWDFNLLKWMKIDEIDLMIRVDEALNRPNYDTSPSTLKYSILEALRREARRKSPKKIKKTWVQFKDKIIDIKTNEIIPVSPDYFVTNPIPWELGDSEDTPFLDKIFAEWVGEENKEVLYEILAYSLLPDYPIHRIFCLFGPGSNGKSVYLNLIKKFVGQNNICSTDLSELINSRFQAMKLYKKLVCVMGEIEGYDLPKTSLLKRLSGGDLISFEEKNKTPFDDYNYAKILIATNNVPKTNDKTEGFYRRWHIIEFPNRFSEKRDILSEIPEQEFRNLALKCCRILKNLLEAKTFTNEGNISMRKQLYEEKSDIVQTFLDKECITSDINNEIISHELYEAFRAFCKQNNYREITNNKFGRELNYKGFETYSKSVFQNDKKTSIQMRMGICLKNKDNIDNIEV